MTAGHRCRAQDSHGYDVRGRRINFSNLLVQIFSAIRNRIAAVHVFVQTVMVEAQTVHVAPRDEPKGKLQKPFIFYL